MTRAGGAVAFWGGIREYAPWPGPFYVFLTGALWAVFGLLIVAAFWARKPWADRALLLGALTYVIWLWLDRLLVQPRLPTNWPYSLIVNVVLLAFVTAVARDPRNRYYLGREAHERQEQNRKTA